MANAAPQQQQQHQQRPRDLLGQATASPGFGNPRFERGCRARVLCYHPDEHRYIRLKNVLFRDFSVTQRWDLLQAAYYPVPGRPTIQAHAGYVQVCHVLQRRRVAGNNNNNNEDDDPALVMLELTPRLAAVKVCLGNRIRELREMHHAEDPLREIAVLQEIQQEKPAHVATVMEVLFDPSNHSYNIVMPYYERGDIHTYMFNSLRDKPALTESEARSLFVQIMTGLKGLHHDLKICHHDMKIENVMLSKDNQAYIIDFGMAVKVPYQQQGSDDNNDPPQRCLVQHMGAFGTFSYMAPELAANQDFDSESIDVWSCGVILFRMLTGQPSYQIPMGADPHFVRMTQRMDRLLALYGIDLSPPCVDLLKGLLQEDPRQRLTINEVLAHPWLI